MTKTVANPNFVDFLQSNILLIKSENFFFISNVKKFQNVILGSICFAMRSHTINISQYMNFVVFG